MAKKKKTIKNKPEPIQQVESAQQKSKQKEPGASNRPGSSLVRTCVLFVAYMAALQVLLNLYVIYYHSPLPEITASIVSSLLNTLGITSTVSGKNIYLRHDTWVVTTECTGILAVCLFASFILAYSSSVKTKLIGLISGVPLIFIANIIRLVVLGWFTDHWPRYAPIIHDYVWETLFIFLIVAMWFLWLNLVVNREKTTAISR